MRHIKIAGLCLVAAFVMSAVASATASAAKPEFLFPEKGTKRQFSAVQSGSASLETKKGETVTCSGGKAIGEVSGAKEARGILFAYTGCRAKVGIEEWKCQSGTTAEEIKTYELLARIGFDAKPEVGILFNPETGKANNPNNLFASFECTNTKNPLNIKVKGSVIGLITPTNTLVEPGGTTKSFAIKFEKEAGVKGVQKDKKLEGESEDKLLSLTTFTTKEKVKETGGEEGWIASAVEGTAEVFPLESMKICTE